MDSVNSAQSVSAEERLVEMLNHAAIVNMIALGHRLALFDEMAKLEWFSIPELSDATRVTPRYLKEWLSVMVTARIVEFDSTNEIFALATDYVGCLTRAAAPNNIAVSTQYIPMMGQTLPLLEQCFVSGKGLPYSAYPNFHKLMSEDSYQTVVLAMFDHILPLMPDMKEKLKSGIRVLDAGCGAGLALLELARAFPKSQFFGYDLCEEAFEDTARLVKAEGIKNLHFTAMSMRDFCDYSFYDLIFTFDAVHDQADPQGMLQSIYSVLADGGVYLMQDIAGSSYLEKNLNHPLGPLIYSISCTHCTPVSLGQGGPGLGTMWGSELAMKMLKLAGFTDVNRFDLPHDPFNMYLVCRK